MTQGKYIKVAKASLKDWEEDKSVVTLSFSNNGNHWTCIDLSRRDLRKLRRTIKKYLKETKYEDLH